MRALLAITLVSSGIIAAAQEPTQIPQKYYPKPKISFFEILLGPNLSGLIGNEEAPARSGQSVYINPLDTKFGYCLGIGVSHYITKHVEISARLFYEQKGYVRSLDTLSFDSNFKFISKTRVWSENVNNNYITLTVQPQLRFGKNDQFRLGAGGYISSLVSSRTLYNGQTSFSYQSDPAYNKYDFGVSFCGGYYYSLNNTVKLSIQIFANYGLSNTSDFFASFNYPKWCNKSYSLLLGIQISPLDKKHHF